MAITCFIRLYQHYSISLYIVGGQVYVHANELLKAAKTTLEDYLATGRNSEVVEQIEQLSTYLFGKLQYTVPFFLPYPQNSKEVLISQVASYHNLSGVDASLLNKWLQNEVQQLKVFLDKDF
jgi:hypothetical protein